VYRLRIPHSYGTHFSQAKSVPREHGVHVYRDEQSLCVTVARFIHDGLAETQPAVIIATPSPPNGIVQQLSHVKFQACPQGESPSRDDLLFIDAHDTLDSFMKWGFCRMASASTLALAA
jgi:hypothetical protein